MQPAICKVLAIIVLLSNLAVNSGTSNAAASTLLEPSLTTSTRGSPVVADQAGDGDKCQGSCMSYAACKHYLGVADGWCILGSTVCCVFESTCGESSSELISFFKSPAYPSSSNQSIQCAHIIHSLKGVCTLRLDFIDLEMSSSIRTSSSLQRRCILDTFLILNNKNVPNEPMCGLNGYSLLLEVNPETPITLLFIMQSTSWKWRIRVKQILCDQIPPWKNERECGQQLLYDENKDGSEYDDDDSNIVSPLVVNGEDAEELEFPWQVSLQFNGAHRCGGSILNEKYILTAAHCVHEISQASLSGFQILAGTVNMTQKVEPLEIESVIVNYDYKLFKSHSNDLALIKLKTPLEYSQAIRPICLPRPKTNFKSNDVIASGWGKTSAQGSGGAAVILQKLNMKLINNSECEELIMSKLAAGRTFDLLNVFEIQKNKVCAIAETNSTLCYGDSGGPLIIRDHKTGRFIQVGIVSYSIGNCVGGTAIVHTRLTEFLQFIEIATST